MLAVCDLLLDVTTLVDFVHADLSTSLLSIFCFVEEAPCH